MATKITFTVDDGLTREEMDDMRYLLADALHGFAAARQPPAIYVMSRYPSLKGKEYAEKVVQTARRLALSQKLFPAMHALEFDHITPHHPMPVFEYYKTCDEADLPAMSAALEFLPATRFGERKGWLVQREGGILILEGPDEQRAFWFEVGERWMWLEEGQEIPAAETVQ